MKKIILSTILFFGLSQAQVTKTSIGQPNQALIYTTATNVVTALDTVNGVKIPSIRLHTSTAKGYAYADSLAVGQNASGAWIRNDGAAMFAEGNTTISNGGKITTNDSMVASGKMRAQVLQDVGLISAGVVGTDPHGKLIDGTAAITDGFLQAAADSLFDTLYVNHTIPNAASVPCYRSGDGGALGVVCPQTGTDSVVFSTSPIITDAILTGTTIATNINAHVIKMDSALISGDRLGMAVRKPFIYDDFDGLNQPVNGRVTPTGQTWAVSGAGVDSAWIRNGKVSTTGNTYMYLSNSGAIVTRAACTFSYGSTQGTDRDASAQTILLDSSSLGLSTMYHMIWGPNEWVLQKRLDGGSFVGIGSGGLNLSTDGTVYAMSIEVDTSANTVTVVAPDGNRYAVADPDIRRIKPTFIGYQIGPDFSNAYKSYFNSVDIGKTIAPSIRAEGLGAAQSDVTALYGTGGTQQQSTSGILVGPGWFRIADEANFGSFAIAGTVNITAHDHIGRNAIWKVDVNSTHSVVPVLAQKYFTRNIGSPITNLRLSRQDTTFQMGLDAYVPNADTVFFDFNFVGVMSPISTPVIGAVPYGEGTMDTAKDGVPNLYVGATDTVPYTDWVRGAAAQIYNDSITGGLSAISALSLNASKFVAADSIFMTLPNTSIVGVNSVGKLVDSSSILTDGQHNLNINSLSSSGSINLGSGEITLNVGGTGGAHFNGDIDVNSCTGCVDASYFEKANFVDSVHHYVGTPTGSVQGVGMGNSPTFNNGTFTGNIEAAAGLKLDYMPGSGSFLISDAGDNMLPIGSVGSGSVVLSASPTLSGTVRNTGNFRTTGTDSVGGFLGVGLANSASKQIANDSSEIVELGSFTSLLKSIGGVPSLAYVRVGGTFGSQTPVTNGQTIFAFQACSDTVTNGLTICNNVLRAIPKGTWSITNRGQDVSISSVDSGTTVTRNMSLTRGDLVVPRHYLTSDSTPVLSSCGTSPAITTGSSDVAGEITEGTIATGCTITFQTAFKQTPFCTITEQSGLSASYTTSNSAITITNIGALSSTKLNYMCIGN